MTNEQIRMEAMGMDTPALASWMQTLAHERAALKGNTQGNRHNTERGQHLKRYIRIIARELNSRQMKLKGF